MPGWERQLVVILTFLLSGSVTPFPYGPHTPPDHGTFFQGWYTRISGPNNVSLAMVMGQYVPGDQPGQPAPENPPVLCMVLAQAPPAAPLTTPTQTTTATTSSAQSSPGDDTEPLQAYVRYFQDMSVTAEGPTRGTSQDTATKGQKAPEGAPRGSGPRASRHGSFQSRDETDDVEPFTVSTKGPPVTGHNAHGSTKRLEIAGGDASFCRLSVDAGLVTLEAFLEGSIHLQLKSSGNTSVATPWSSRSASPEGWVGRLGPLVRLHYSTLSLADPVTFTLSRPAPAPANAPSTSQHSSDHARTQSAAKGVPDAGTAAVPEKQGSVDVAAPDQSATTPSTNPHAQPSRGVAGVDVNAATAGWTRVSLAGGVAHLEAQYGQGFPPRWLWAQGHGMDPATGRTSSFVMAGGDLPHALSPPLPMLHEFLFSFRSGDVSVSVDPWNPPLPFMGTRERVDACGGTVSLDMTTLTHKVQIILSAPPSSFTPVACPSESGFTDLSVESFTARASITIYKQNPFKQAAARVMNFFLQIYYWVLDGSVEALRRSAHLASATGGRASETETETAGASVPRDQAEGGWSTWGAPQLVVKTVVTGAALEFGGHYRCEGAGMESAS